MQVLISKCVYDAATLYSTATATLVKCDAATAKKGDSGGKNVAPAGHPNFHSTTAEHSLQQQCHPDGGSCGSSSSRAAAAQVVTATPSPSSQQQSVHAVWVLSGL